MRAARVLTIAILLIAAAAAQAAADAITDPAALGAGGSGTPLFDGSGVAFLLTTSPTYSQLPGNDNSGNSNEGNGDGGSGGTSFNPIFFSFLSDPFGSGPGNSGNSSGGTNSEENTPSITFNLDFSDSGATGGGSSTNLLGGGGGGGESPTLDQRQVPEPATVLLIGAGFAALMRRRSRSSATV